jgi:hypothetical protein
VLPRRLGARFALEALFLVLLAVGAGLAHLRPLYIVGVMAAAWVLVALAELTAERIDRSPLSYLLPERRPDEEDEPERVFGPRPEERTVVAPPEPELEEERESAPLPEPEPEPIAETEDEVEADDVVTAQEPEREPEPEPEPAAKPLVRASGQVEGVTGESGGSADEQPQPRRPRRLRSLLRRQEPEPEPEAPSPPRHVKLLPRRTAPEPSRASQEVAELFGEREEEAAKPEETGT